MAQYINKSALVAEIENLKNTYKKCPTRNSYEEGLKDGRLIGYTDALHKINTLEVKDPYEQCIQYDSIKAGIQANAETYSFNIESKLFNQLTKEQQGLWREEIERAYISGGDAGVTLARDTRYKENLEVKEVDLEKEIKEQIDKYYENCNKKLEEMGEDDNDISFLTLDGFARHFYELGLKAQNND